MTKFIYLFLLNSTLIAQKSNKNYLEYHEGINKAELLFFQENKSDSALYYYDKVFNQFDFIFVKDIVNAIQISVFSNKNPDNYLVLGFENGLKIKHLQKFPVLKSLFNKLENDTRWKKEYEEKRKAYLKKIDYNYLNWINIVAINDESRKFQEPKNYFEILEKHINAIKDTMKVKGFAGEKLIGIQDATIFKEIKSLKYQDLSEQVKKVKKNNQNFKIDEIDETDFMAIAIMPVLTRFFCSIKYLSLNSLLMEVKKGNIHPRDIALLNDLSFIGRNRMPTCCNGYKLEGLYFSSFGLTSKPIDIIKANELRKKTYMCSYELDMKKKEFEKKFKFIIFSGMLDYR